MIVLPAGGDVHSWSLAPPDNVIDLTEPSGKTDEDLVHYLSRVSFANASFMLACFAGFDYHSWQALTFSEGLTARRVAKIVQAGKIVELESEVATQAKRIAELEEAYASLKLEKENVTAGYRSLADKYKTPEEKTEHKKTDAAKAHAAQLAEVEEKLANEM
jgi:uncharacterized coiled-coil protein SlyX